MNLCPTCGEELDDFSPCACVVEARPTTGSMREMVRRKLAKKRGETFRERDAWKTGASRVTTSGRKT